jgi:small subunit ribosomal protein S7
MPRRRVANKRKILPDPKFGSVILAKFINTLMVDGKKSIAEKVVYGALEQLENNVDKGKLGSSDNGGKLDNVADVFQYVVDKVRPKVEVRSRRVGGATYQIPCEVKPNRGTALAMRWIVQSARQRHERGMMLRLAHELQDILNEKGASIKKKEDVYRMAQANQAFAHFRWN